LLGDVYFIPNENYVNWRFRFFLSNINALFIASGNYLMQKKLKSPVFLNPVKLRGAGRVVEVLALNIVKGEKFSEMAPFCFPFCFRN
jgi:hypothetical protein